MKVFKTIISGKFLFNILKYGTPTIEVIEDKLPDDAELISTEYSKGNLELYFLSETTGNEIPEGADIRNYAKIIMPVFKTVYGGDQD